MRRRYLAAGAAVLLGAGAVLAYALGTNGGAGRADPADPRQVALGNRLYDAACASCHGKDLEGQPEWRSPLPTGGLPAPPHDETGHTWHHPDRILFRITKLGGAAEAPAGFRSNMPAFGGALSDAEIWAILAYIKSRWPEPIRLRQAEIDRRNRGG